MTSNRPERTRGFESDGLVRVWNLYPGGNIDAARETLMAVWAVGIDELASKQAARVAFGLFERLAPCVGDADRWESLPDEIQVFRAGELGGHGWSLNRRVAEHLARENDLVSIHEGHVGRSEVAAFITVRARTTWSCIPSASACWRRLLETSDAEIASQAPISPRVR